MISLFKFKDNDGRLKTRKIFLWAALIVIAICVVYFIVLYFVVPTNMEKRGQLGDMYGLIGALFSGLAFAGVIVTMLQQSETIDLQREDISKQTTAIELQKQEIAQTNKELKEQNKTFLLQRFENTFFNMLKSQMEIRDSIKFFEHIGKDAFVSFFQSYTSSVRRYGYNEVGNPGYNEHLFEQHLDHYIRHLTQTLKMIDTADFLSAQEKYYYSEILSSHMSKFELGMFLYYCLLDEGKATVKELVESLALFKCLKNSDYIPQEALAQFSDGAFTQK